MKLHSNLLAYVRQQKENPLTKIDDFPSIPKISVEHFDIALELCEKYVHKKNNYLKGSIEINRQYLLEGKEPDFEYRSIKEMGYTLKLHLYRHWCCYHPNLKKIEEEVDYYFPENLYEPLYELEKLVQTLLQPISANVWLKKSLSEADQVDLNEVEELIEKCNQIQDPVLVKGVTNER